MVQVTDTDSADPAAIIRGGDDGVTLPPDDVDAWAQAAAAIARRGRRTESRGYAIERFNSQRHATTIVSAYEPPWQGSDGSRGVSEACDQAIRAKQCQG